MITKNMSDMEIIKELESIDAILKSRRRGHWKKFGKKLNSKLYKDREVLNVSEYVINENKVLVCFQKLALTDKLFDLGVSYIVVTKRNGAFFPFKNYQGNIIYHHFTNHAVHRMQQRKGLTIKDFFVNECAIKSGFALHTLEYPNYGYDDSTYIMAMGECLFIVCKCDNKFVVKTCLNRDRLHPNQDVLYLDSKKGAGEYAGILYDRNANFLKGMGITTTSDLISTMSA